MLTVMCLSGYTIKIWNTLAWKCSVWEAEKIINIMFHRQDQGWKVFGFMQTRRRVNTPIIFWQDTRWDYFPQITTTAVRLKNKKKKASDGQYKQTLTRTEKFHGKWDLLLLKYVDGIYPEVNS